ncbi:TM1266 family iron-only hydrogenase system putative regulator [Ruminococcus sp.]|uniref:TM1266 family iron-only hydrogenase system putative regulator n=1 Tax=Ruminococcus sp. TaxID=41978 RepID=UPI0025F9BD10|nr:TM1266 family iron-only hydrogenase system putative regulator [Ruminococcus sp.]MBQ8966623.1 CopG family transcriptional regulator [Ruminococcus sp.]
MESEVAVAVIIVERGASVEGVNSLLHEYSDYIIGRMGVPYKDKGINIISVAFDAPADIIEELSEKVNALEGISSNTVFSVG